MATNLARNELPPLKNKKVIDIKSDKKSVYLRETISNHQNTNLTSQSLKVWLVKQNYDSV
jgi:hypothetical protein